MLLPPTLIEKIKEKEKAESPFFSLEFFPPRTKPGAINLFARFDRISAGAPLFIDITWGAGGGDPSSDDYTSSLSVASTALNYCGLTTMLHLTAIGSTKEEIKRILQRAKDVGVKNILALRGDLPANRTVDTTTSELPYATDLVKFIRQEFGDYFGICVAGYPNGHPDCTSKADDLKYLKMKVDAGADFIITQLFFDSKTFIDYVKECRAIGITCPIIPGILPIQSYASLRHLMKLSKLRPPDDIIAELEAKKDDDEAIREFGVEIATKMCMEILESKTSFGFHFYTLNREVAVKEILHNLKLWKADGKKANFPWLASANEKRAKEAIRPIFWSTRPKSYLMRTNHWDEFPNGRWGDSSSPAFGNLSEYYLFRAPGFDNNEKRKIWGESLASVKDVATVFCNFLTGTISRLPWSEETNSLALETKKIEDRLLFLNKNGILTTNSQPAVNQASSTDPVHGWGEENGYVYQKAYLEFFICPSLFSKLLEALSDFPLISYHAMNNEGKTYTNIKGKSVNAVTWGVFPGKEIIQPTVVDPGSFPIWKDEAFGLWKSEWQSLYEPDTASHEIIGNIYNTYYLVNIVDNNFVSGNIFAPFEKLFSSTEINNKAQ